MDRPRTAPHAMRRTRSSRASYSPRGLHLEPLEDRRMLATFSVGNTDDAGVGSLRQAIIDANNSLEADTIEFDQVVFESVQTISLASALPTILGEVIISGPGKNLLTLDAGNGTDNLSGTGDGFRVFDIDDGNSGNTVNVTLQGMTLTGGDVSGDGGAIATREDLTIEGVAIVDNATGPGTAGANGAPGQDGDNGTRGGHGGGIFSSGGNLTIIDSTISGNATGAGGAGGNGGDGANGTNGQDGGDGGYGGSGGYGGGIFSDGGDLDISNSTISGNSTGSGGMSGSAGQGGEPDLGGSGGSGGNGGDGGYGGNGGGIYSSVGEITISGSTISGNFTGAGNSGANGADGGSGATGGDGGYGGNGGNGGGMYSVEGSLEISSSTITGNWAGNGGAGGGSGLGGFLGGDGNDGNGGGVNSLGNDPVNVDNSIIAANLAVGADDDLRTGSVTLNINYSLIGVGDSLTLTSGTGNQLGTALLPIDPMLGPLAGNGGPTQTHALLPSSSAIDAGDPSIAFDVNEFDQRGASFFRVRDGNLFADIAIDMGAYEAQSAPSADFDQDGDVDGTDFLTWQRGFDTTMGATRENGNSDDDDDVDASDLAVWVATYVDGTLAIGGLQALSNPAISDPIALMSLSLLAVEHEADDKLSPQLFQPEVLSNENEEAVSVLNSQSAEAISGSVFASQDAHARDFLFSLNDDLLGDFFLE